jgi:hypothetical protein
MNTTKKKANPFLGFIKNNWFFLSMLVIGLILLYLFISQLHKAVFEITPNIRLLGYCSYFLIITSLTVFFIKRKKVILANIMILVELVVILEIICFFLLGMPAAYKKDFSIPLLPDDHVARNIGVVPYSDSVYTSVLVKNGVTVYNVKNSIDSNWKRITPDHDSTIKSYALFFGCSIAFGTGLEDNQTLPYYFQQESGNYNSYNFAYPGYGTNHMLARLEYQNLSKQVTEKNGIVFYVFFWDHIYRAIGTMDRYIDWMHNAPYYTMQDGKLVRKKMFKDGRYYLSKVYELLYQSSIIKYFKIDFPLQLSDRHYDLVSEMIKVSKEKCAEQFGNDNFYVVIYPNVKKYKQKEMDRFKEYLVKKKINCIDLSDFIEYQDKYTLGGDSHPNANTNKLIANELIKQLSTFKKN